MQNVMCKIIYKFFSKLLFSNLIFNKFLKVNNSIINI